MILSPNLQERHKDQAVKLKTMAHRRAQHRVRKNRVCSSQSLQGRWKYSQKIADAIAIIAGETKDPARTVPKVVRNVFWQILLFYLLSVQCRFQFGADCNDCEG